VKMPDFNSGNDVQRSLNLADNRCVNLYPVTDDSGTIAAFYSTPGLLAYTSAASAFSGLYTASNGRCFGVSGTILYEITTGGVLTNRGTVTTASVSKMSDNGIELIIVNGTDAWLFTFATNALKKISTLSADFTVTIASPAVFSTVAAHGLVAGDAIQLTTTSGSNTTSGVLTASTASPITAPDYVTSVITSPDSQYVYIATNNVNGYIYQYIRDQVTGDLSPLSPAFIPIPGGYGSSICYCLEITSDGAFIFAGSGGSIHTFSRNAVTGQITWISATTYAIQTFYSIKLSSDGTSLYAYGKSGFSPLVPNIYQYSVNPATGTVTPLSPATISASLDTVYSSAISSNAGTTQTLYVLSPSTNLIQCYTRTVATGLLTAITSVATGAGSVSIIISHDNAHVYVSCTNAIRHYTRNTGTGVITLADTLTTTNNPSQLVISADDTCVYASSPDGVVMEFDRNTTTGVLTAMSTPTVPAAGTINAIAITANGKSVYAMSYGPVGASFTYMFQRQQSSSNVGLPTGLDTLTTYYVIAAGLTATNFEVSLTAGGTAVNTSGVQAGIHTFHTLGNGFPNGAKTISYIDGRFVVCQPNTQNFYVSDVLAGGTWDALNVQTADSNPDMIVGQITLHNELIVFCEQSGETFYDSGTYPAPFVRNVSGIFEVGCIAPYSIAKIDNSVMWLGKSNTGQGVIYRLNGYTPVRLSTYAIEYAIQTMTTISDAMAFTYQQEGHHFYVITFPTGNRTFAFDVNTGLWHERAGWNGATLSRWAAQEYTYFDGKHLICDYASGNIYSLDLGTYTDGVNAKKWIRSWRAPASDMKRVIHNKLTLEAEVGVGQGSFSTTGVVNSITLSNPGSSSKTVLWNAAVSSGITDMTVYGISWSGSIYVAVGMGNTYGSDWTINYCYTSPDGVVWTKRTMTITQFWYGVSWNGSVFCAVGNGQTCNTSPDGITWTARTMSSVQSHYAITYGAGFFVACVNGEAFETSPDGITWTARNDPGSGGISWSSITYNGTAFIATAFYGSTAATAAYSTDGITWVSKTLPFNQKWCVSSISTGFVALSNGTNYATSPDGITWTARTFPVALSIKTGNQFISGGGVHVIANSGTNNSYVSEDGITWTLDAIPGVLAMWGAATYNGTNIVYMSATSGGGYTSAFTSGPAGYNVGPHAIIFTGGTPTVAATGTYTISSITGEISSTVITNTGSGYITTPTVSFPSGGIIGAIGSANLTWTSSFNPTGIEPTVNLKYSNDGGHTWSTDNWRSMSLGTIGQYSKRVFWYRLGMTTGQVRLYELSGQSPVKTVLLSTYLE